MKGIKLVIFDLDGTLVNAYPAIVQSFNSTMRKIGSRRQNPSVIRRAVGWGDKLLLRPFVKKKDLNRALRIYRSHHAFELLRGARLYAGAAKTLAFLKKNGYKIAVASNRPTKFSRILMRHLNISRFFDYALCADRLSRRKPHPQILNEILMRMKVNANEAVFVGDMAIDAQAGNRAHIKTFIVSRNQDSGPGLPRYKPFKLIKNISGLMKYLS